MYSIRRPYIPYLSHSTTTFISVVLHVVPSLILSRFSYSHLSHTNSPHPLLNSRTFPLFQLIDIYTRYHNHSAILKFLYPPQTPHSPETHVYPPNPGRRHHLALHYIVKAVRDARKGSRVTSPAAGGRGRLWGDVWGREDMWVNPGSPLHPHPHPSTWSWHAPPRPTGSLGPLLLHFLLLRLIQGRFFIGINYQ